MSMKTLIAIAAFTCASFHVHAEKWVNVGVAVSTRVGPADIYADADSAVRTGDLAKIKFKALAEPKIDEVNFDCKKNLELIRK